MGEAPNEPEKRPGWGRTLVPMTKSAPFWAQASQGRLRVRAWPEGWPCGGVARVIFSHVLYHLSYLGQPKLEGDPA